MIVFAVKTEERQHLHYSFFLCCVAVVITVIASVFLAIGSKSETARKEQEQEHVNKKLMSTETKE